VIEKTIIGATGDDRYKCIHCLKILSSNRNLQRHFETCKEKIKKDAKLETNGDIDELKRTINEKNRVIDEKNKVIDEKNREIEIILSEKEHCIIEYSLLEKDGDKINEKYINLYQEFIDFIKNIHNDIDNKMVYFNSRTTQIHNIIKNYNNAINFNDLMKGPLTKQEYNLLLNKGLVNGCVNILGNKCIKKLSESEKPFHCINVTRNDYLLRMNDDWIIDINGATIVSTLFNIIITTSEFMNHIDEHSWNKLIKDLSNNREKHKKISRISSILGTIR
jgi:hypothetical protein